jgi:hypothetical protein
MRTRRLVVAAALVLVACTCELTDAQQAAAQPAAATDMTQRLAALKAANVDASMTILPIRLGGHPFDRVSEVVGVLLEQQGVRSVEVGRSPFDPGEVADLAALADSLGVFVRAHPIATDYALYAEYNGTPQTGIAEVRGIVVDRAGAPVWLDRQGQDDPAFRSVTDRDPMGFSVMLVERLGPQMGLNEETAKAAKPGKMAALMAERSGMPPESETAPLPARLKDFKARAANATLAVYPVRIGERTVSAESAPPLAKLIARSGVCKATAVKQPLVLESPLGMNEMKSLWDLARAFRDQVRRSPPDADYALYANYVFNPERWEQGFVHLIVCDRHGDWVIVDLQNSVHPDYQSVQPRSKEDCDRLLIKRLKSYLD